MQLPHRLTHLVPGTGCAALIADPVLTQFTSSTFHTGLVAPPVLELPLSTPAQASPLSAGSQAGRPRVNLDVALPLGGGLVLLSKEMRCLSRAPLGAVWQPAVPGRGARGAVDISGFQSLKSNLSPREKYSLLLGHQG